MQILLTNDDGIFAPGLAAMHAALSQLGEVHVVAPAVEQSGVGHSITFLTPLMAKEVYDGAHRRGWAVEGSPADCVKLALGRLCPQRPDLVVSGINGGLNVGINVLYSGTVAAATEGALNGVPSIAVSLEYDEKANFAAAAKLAVAVIRQMLDRNAFATQRLYNLNIPTEGLVTSRGLKVVPMGTAFWPADFEERRDPKGRRYYWATGNPPTQFPTETDLTAIREGFVTLTPLGVDRTEHSWLASASQLNLTLPNET